MTKTQWHTEPPSGEDRPLWVTREDGAVNWEDSRQIRNEERMSSGLVLAWAEYTPEKPEPYQPPSQPTAEEIEAWRELEERIRPNLQWLSDEHPYHRIFNRLDAARGKK